MGQAGLLAYAIASMVQQVATLSQIYYVVLPLLLRAGQVLVTRQKELAGLSTKARHDRGKDIESEIRTFLETTLTQLFPKHAIYASPNPKTNAAANPLQWVVVPLEGGRYYFRGLPLYATSLALRREGEIVLGIVVEPAAQSVFHALKGGGAFLNGQTIGVSEEKMLASACVYFDASRDDTPATKRRHETIHQALVKGGCRVNAFEVTSLGLCYLAAAALDAFIGFRDDPSLQQFMAGLVIAKEAGAIIMDGEGKPLRATSASNTILVAAPGVARQCLLLVQPR